MNTRTAWLGRRLHDQKKYMRERMLYFILARVGVKHADLLLAEAHSSAADRAGGDLTARNESRAKADIAFERAVRRGVPEALDAYVKFIFNDPRLNHPDQQHRRAAGAFITAAENDPQFLVEAVKHFIASGDLGRAGALLAGAENGNVEPTSIPPTDPNPGSKGLS